MAAKGKGKGKGKTTPKTQKGKKATTPRKPRAKKVEKVVEPEVVETVVEPEVVEKVSEPVVETETVVEQSTPSSTGSGLEEVMRTQLSSLLDTVSVLMTQLKGVQAEIKTVQKNYTKLLKEHDKTKNKSKRQNRKPSGFAKPSALTEDMTQFLGLDKDVEIARNEVTKLINKYIVDNNLRNEQDKRKIQPDKKLAKLLNFDVNGDEQLSYFNLQKYIKHHFVKTEVVA